MPEKNPSLSFSIAHSVKDIPQSEWENLFSPRDIEGFGYQKTLEECLGKEFTFGYLLGRRQNKLAAVIPFFIMDFSFDTLMPELLRRPVMLLQKAFPRFFRKKVLFLGAPTAEEFYFGASKAENLQEIFTQAMEKLSAFSKNEKISGLAFHNLSEKDSGLMGFLKTKGFFKMETLPSTLIEINALSLKDYMSALKKNVRKDLRRKMNRAACLNLRSEIRDDIKDISGRIYALYLNNFDAADVRFEHLTEKFFAEICSNMPGTAKYFLTFEQDKLIAFNLCLIKDDTFIDKFIGFDKELSRKYHLYFITFCHNLDWCVKNNIKFYFTGVSDYYPKTRLGAKLVPLYIYCRADNPLLHCFLKAIAGLIEPKNIDPSLKKVLRD